MKRLLLVALAVAALLVPVAAHATNGSLKAKLEAGIASIDAKFYHLHDKVTCIPVPKSLRVPGRPVSFVCKVDYGKVSPAFGTSCIVAVFWFNGPAVPKNISFDNSAMKSCRSRSVAPSPPGA